MPNGETHQYPETDPVYNTGDSGLITFRTHNPESWLYVDPCRLTSPHKSLDHSGQRKHKKPNMHATQRQGATTSWHANVSKYKQEAIAQRSLTSREMTAEELARFSNPTEAQLRAKAYQRGA